MIKMIINLFLLLTFKVFNKFGKLKKNRREVLNSKRILEINFPKNKEFSFVQVGANDGISFDFLYDFLIKRKTKGVVIEPLDEYFQQLKQNYSNFDQIIKVRKAVHLTAKEINIYKVSKDAFSKYPDWITGIASLDPNHHKRIDIDSNDIVSETVSCDTLMNILSQNYNYKTMDYLQIDTEGFDYEVLKMYDFAFLKPSIIKFEYVHLNEKDRLDSINFLRKNGYYIFNETEDTIGIRLNKIKLW